MTHSEGNNLITSCFEIKATEELKFHSSYELQMRAYDLIEKEGFWIVKHSRNGLHTVSIFHNDINAEMIVSASDKDRKTAYWTGLVGFAQWKQNDNRH